jgi:hypothetical protein
MTDAPLLRAAGLWRKTSKNGRDYYVGALGGVKVLILENTDRDRGENDPTHYLLLFGERQQRQPASDCPQYRGDRTRRPPSEQEKARAAVANQAQAPLDHTELALADFDQRYGPQP